MKPKNHDEIPIGACLMDINGNLLASAGNLTNTNCDSTVHTEILVLREAGVKIGNYRPLNTTLYTTIEPCAMSAAPIGNARVKRLVFGAYEERSGAVETICKIGEDVLLNYRSEITGRVPAEKCRNLMQTFFRQKHYNPKNLK